MFRWKTHLQVLMAVLALESQTQKGPRSTPASRPGHCESCGAPRERRGRRASRWVALSADALRPRTSPRTRPETPVTRCRRATAQHGGQACTSVQPTQ